MDTRWNNSEWSWLPASSDTSPGGCNGTLEGDVCYGDHHIAGSLDAHIKDSLLSLHHCCHQLPLLHLLQQTFLNFWLQSE